MNRNSLKIILFSMFLLSLSAAAQKKDTVYISSKSINTNVLKEGTNRYLVYFKMSKNSTRTQTQFWTRKIERSLQNNKQVIAITQEWEDKDSIIHTVNSVCEAATMKPLTHEFWWKKRAKAKIDFEHKTVEYNGSQLTAADTAKQRRAVWAAFETTKDNYFLNWHLDLEVFPTLPYKSGTTFIIPFYDPGTSAPFEKAAYTVTGSEVLIGYDDQKIDCWLLSHESQGNKELYWISKKTKEVLKLEQEVSGRFYRYKVKLGFSI